MKKSRSIHDCGGSWFGDRMRRCGRYGESHTYKWVACCGYQCSSVFLMSFWIHNDRKSRDQCICYGDL